MGCLTFLVSNDTKEYYDLGKLYWGSSAGVDDDDDEDVFALKNSCHSEVLLVQKLSDLLHDSEDKLSKKMVAAMAADAAKWMLAHPDWRYMTEYDDEYEDVYLAEDEEDAKEYLEEFPDIASPIYRRTGDIWKAV